MRYELTDDEWAAIRPMLPSKARGVPRVDDRRVLNGIFWVLRPARHGVTCRVVMARTPPATIASSVGGGLAYGADLWPHLLPLTIRPSK